MPGCLLILPLPAPLAGPRWSQVGWVAPVPVSPHPARLLLRRAEGWQALVAHAVCGHGGSSSHRAPPDPPLGSNAGCHVFLDRVK